ncbi:MAG TPA: hypothetical protein VF783_22450, partial [Terriglobales bacterium]
MFWTAVCRGHDVHVPQYLAPGVDDVMFCSVPGSEYAATSGPMSILLPLAKTICPWPESSTTISSWSWVLCFLTDFPGASTSSLDFMSTLAGGVFSNLLVPGDCYRNGISTLLPV